MTLTADAHQLPRWARSRVVRPLILLGRWGRALPRWQLALLLVGTGFAAALSAWMLPRPPWLTSALRLLSVAPVVALVHLDGYGKGYRAARQSGSDLTS